MTVIKESYAYELLQGGKRLDGRGFSDFRNVDVKTGVISKAEGSALVKLGDTQVLVGVKIGIGTPFPDTPGEGILIVNAEFSPLASPDFEAGPPSEDAVELARVVDRGIRESKCIPFEELGVSEGKVLTVFVDIDIINHHGNLLDAAALGAIAALSSAKIPKIQDEKVVPGEYEKELPVKFKPVNITVCKFGEKFLVDPLLEEEDIIDAKLSVSTREDGNICALQKQGKKGVKFGDLEKMIDIAIEKGNELRKILER